MNHIQQQVINYITVHNRKCEMTSGQYTHQRKTTEAIKTEVCIVCVREPWLPSDIPQEYKVLVSVLRQHQGLDKPSSC